MNSACRKYQNELIVTGNGVILFGIWSLVRAIMMLLFPSDARDQLLSASGTAVQTQLVIILTIVLFFILVGIDLVLRLFIGISARREAYGMKKRRGYLGAAIVLLCAYFALDAYSVYLLPRYPANLVVNILYLVIDLTSILALLWLINACVRFRKIRKQMAEEEVPDAA